MPETPRPADKEQWVVWNGFFGIPAMATIGRVEVGTDGRNAWLDPPFDMVGPFNLDELETRGRIAFAACIVMSRQRWQDDQVELRRESRERRRAAQERLYGEHGQFNGGRRRHRPHRQPHDDRQHRETLNLPVDGKLTPTQIKTAYRRLAQKAHPDVGGSHEQFLRITEARNALLDHI
ncbi:DnaJ domain-containing protein [Methylomagnum ishizawai]|uniref:DnaJ domain-containing protein n=1 Tax=Methylomagnum ishizawai TaxID=1760988 RepID=A0A1Y6D722_9GAMM|nr:J domain-containing protein [Methylomagnum ishizawai]SMF96593.1 DnaJ domain-containing protein [Methylomagnum ishizawai]